MLVFPNKFLCVFCVKQIFCLQEHQANSSHHPGNELSSPERRSSQSRRSRFWLPHSGVHGDPQRRQYLFGGEERRGSKTSSGDASPCNDVRAIPDRTERWISLSCAKCCSDSSVDQTGGGGLWLLAYILRGFGDPSARAAETQWFFAVIDPGLHQLFNCRWSDHRFYFQYFWPFFNQTNIIRGDSFAVRSYRDDDILLAREDWR